MRVSVFGLGYVGTVSAACLAQRGHSVVGVDVNPDKVELLNKGRSSFVEPALEAIVAAGVRSRALRATQDAKAAVLDTDASFICVGTPSEPSGAVNLRGVVSVCREIGEAIRAKTSRHIIVVRSTVPPGTLRNLVTPALEEGSGKIAGVDFDIACNPEFLREGSAISDFNNPPKTVIGADADAAAALVESLYAGLPGEFVRTSPEVAEFVKYVDNPWHALKVTFANEIGNICKSAGVDSMAVMEIFLLDRKLNISPAYLRPGFAFGGSCLPKDLRAITHLAKSLDLRTPLLNAAMESNKAQIERALEMVVSIDRRNVGVLGCSFKAGTDDLRESPYVELIERLIGKGFNVKIYDLNVRLSALIGANREFLMRKLPHISSILVETADEAMADANVVLLTTLAPEYVSALPRLREDQRLLDFAGLNDRQGLSARYDGVNW